MTTGHAPVQDEGPPAKAGRQLVAQETLDGNDLVTIHQDMKARVLKADTLRSLSGLPDLAKEHISHFKRVYGGRLPPNKTIFIASASTGTTADSLSFYAAREALKTLYPELRFEHVIHCEIKQNKRTFISELQTSLAPEFGTAHGAACIFEDIGHLGGTHAKCTTHFDPGKNNSKILPDQEMLRVDLLNFMQRL